MKKNLSQILLLSLIIFAFILSGCGALRAEPSALSNEEVIATTEELLAALENGDYETFISNMSDPMVEAFTEDAFQQTQAMLAETSGNVTSCGEPTLLNQQEYAVYRVPCTFQKEEVTVTTVYPIGGDTLEGLFFDSPGLRAYTKQE